MDATRVVLRPDLWDGRVPTVAEALLAAPPLAGLTGDALAAQHAAGEVVDLDGAPVDLDGPVVRPTPVYLYRGLPDEFDVPFELRILHRDDSLVVVDKPHFLATMPRGQHVTQTALVRLRRLLDEDALAPAHRLDRLTAGVLLFTRKPSERAAYQSLFADRLVHKEYRAIAPVAERLADPVHIANRIEKTSGDLRALVVDGPVNAISDISLLGVRDDGLGEYRLIPHTGRTHQLRLHMAGLGVPILGDPLYPTVDPELASAPERGDFSRPLHLIASSLRFVDPITGVERHFVSDRR
ncbi:pseudouridine synthase [Gordonia phosphorivorans]